jgi:hypothetical protein
MKHLFASLFLAFLFVLPNIQAQNEPKVWKFSNHVTEKVHQFKEGQNLRIKWQGQSKVFKSKGKLVDITKDALVLNMDKKVETIAKRDIISISRGRPSAFGLILVFLIVVIGVFIIGFALLQQGVYTSTRTDFQLASGEKKNYWRWSFLGIATIALGFMTLKALNLNISDPFGPNWTVKEKIITPSNMP